jgi:hypothetical protein
VKKIIKVSEKFLHHNLRCSCHNVLSLFAIARSDNLSDVVELPRTLIAAQLLALVTQLSVGKVLVVEGERRPRSTRRRCRLVQRTVMDTMLNEIRCRLVVGVQRHEGCCRIDSFTGHFTPKHKITQNQKENKIKSKILNRVSERKTLSGCKGHAKFWIY